MKLGESIMRGIMRRKTGGKVFTTILMLLLVTSIQAVSVRLVGSVSFGGNAQPESRIKIEFQGKDTTTYTDQYGLFDITINVANASGLISIQTVNCIGEVVSKMAYYTTTQQFIKVDFNLCRVNNYLISSGQVFYHNTPAWGVTIEFSLNEFKTILEQTTTDKYGNFSTYLSTGPHETGNLSARVLNCNGQYVGSTIPFLSGDTAHFSLLKCKPNNQSLVTGQVKRYIENSQKGDAKLLLYTLNEETMSINLADSAMTQSGGGYSFFVNDSHNYIIKVLPVTPGSNLFPSYTHGSLFWDDDAVIRTDNTGAGVLNKDITIYPTFKEFGTAQLSGKVEFRSGHRLSQSHPAVMLLNLNKHPVAYTYMQGNREYVFNDIPEGDYLVWIDEPGIPTIPLQVHVGKNDDDVNLDVLVVDAQGIHPEALQTESYDLQNRVSIYPNPFGEFIRIDLGGNDCAELKITSISGELVHHQDVCTSEQLSTSELQSGVYLITIQTEKQVFNQRMVKK